jgi:hypothetical protein
LNLASLEAIARALESEGVRYLVVGGLAVGAHGYPRLTLDVDVVLSLRRENVLSAFRALSTLGFRPAVPVTAEAFADEAQRERWRSEKGMQVLNFFSDAHRTMPVDVFVTEPFDFEAEYARALVEEIAPGIAMRFVSLATLIAMKESVARARDLDDIEHLRIIARERSGG